MKRTYNAPAVRYINLESEGMCAGSPDKVGFGEGNLDAKNAYTQEKDMWGNEDIWK